MDSGLPTIDPAHCRYCDGAWWFGPCAWHLHEGITDAEWARAVVQFRTRQLVEGLTMWARELAHA